MAPSQTRQTSTPAYDNNSVLYEGADQCVSKCLSIDQWMQPVFP